MDRGPRSPAGTSSLFFSQMDSESFSVFFFSHRVFSHHCDSLPPLVSPFLSSHSLFLLQPNLFFKPHKNKALFSFLTRVYGLLVCALFLLIIYCCSVHCSKEMEPTQLSISRWIMKTWYIYKMQYYSAPKKNEITKFAEKWIKLECTILSKVTQSQKERKPHVFPHMQNLAYNVYMYICKQMHAQVYYNIQKGEQERVI